MCKKMSNFLFPLFFSKIFSRWFKRTTLIKLLSFFNWVTSFNHEICPQTYIVLSTSVFKYFKYCLWWKNFLKMIFIWQCTIPSNFFVAKKLYGQYVLNLRRFKSPMIFHGFVVLWNIHHLALDALPYFFLVANMLN